MTVQQENGIVKFGNRFYILKGVTERVKIHDKLIVGGTNLYKDITHLINKAKDKYPKPFQGKQEITRRVKQKEKLIAKAKT